MDTWFHPTLNNTLWWLIMQTGIGLNTRQKNRLLKIIKTGQIPTLKCMAKQLEGEITDRDQHNCWWYFCWRDVCLSTTPTYVWYVPMPLHWWVWMTQPPLNNHTKWYQSNLKCNPSLIFSLSTYKLDSFIRWKFGIRQGNYFNGFGWHDKWPILLTWINFNSSMDKLTSITMFGVEIIYPFQNSNGNDK